MNADGTFIDEGFAPIEQKQERNRKRRARKKKATKFKKAPQAPRRFKSAYMFFSTDKHKEIRDQMGKEGIAEKTTNIAKLVSQAWKDLPAEVRSKYEEMARKDKARYEIEKEMYNGPWKVPAKLKKNQKDPNVPRRPMSAFLSYSNTKRPEAREAHPEMNNAELSRYLAQMWRNAPESEKKEFKDREYQLRQKYLSDIAVYRENTEKELMEQRKQREEIAMKAVAEEDQKNAEDGDRSDDTIPVHRDMDSTRDPKDDLNSPFDDPPIKPPPTTVNEGKAAAAASVREVFSPTSRTLSAKAVLKAALTVSPKTPKTISSPDRSSSSASSKRPRSEVARNNGDFSIERRQIEGSHEMDAATGNFQDHSCLPQPIFLTQKEFEQELIDSEKERRDSVDLSDLVGLDGGHHHSQHHHQQHHHQHDDERQVHPQHPSNLMDDDGPVDVQKMFVEIFSEYSQDEEEEEEEDEEEGAPKYSASSSSAESSSAVSPMLTSTAAPNMLETSTPFPNPFLSILNGDESTFHGPRAAATTTNTTASAAAGSASQQEIVTGEFSSPLSSDLEMTMKQLQSEFN